MATETKQPAAPARPAARPVNKAPGAPRPSGSPRPARRPLTPEEHRERERRRALRQREEEERRREEEKERKARAKKTRRVLFVASLVLALVFTAVYWAFVGFSIKNRSAVPKALSDKYYPLLIYTEGSEKEDLSYKAKDQIFDTVNKRPYVPLSCFKKYVPVTLSGDPGTRVILLANGDEAKFYLGTDHAVINGEDVFLSAPAFLKNGELYLPLDFLTDHMNCFSFNSSVIINNVGKCNVLSFIGTVAPGMTSRTSSGCTKVDRSTVPPDPVPTESPAAA